MKDINFNLTVRIESPGLEKAMLRIGTALLLALRPPQHVTANDAPVVRFVPQNGPAQTPVESGAPPLAERQPAGNAQGATTAAAKPRRAPVKTRKSWLFSDERDAVIMADWPAAMLPKPLCDKLNALPGPKLEEKQIANRAAVIGAKRPCGFSGLLARHGHQIAREAKDAVAQLAGAAPMESQVHPPAEIPAAALKPPLDPAPAAPPPSSPKFTAERQAAIRATWRMLVREVVAAVNRLPGPPVTPEEVVAHGAGTMGLTPRWKLGAIQPAPNVPLPATQDAPQAPAAIQAPHATPRRSAAVQAAHNGRAAVGPEDGATRGHTRACEETGAPT